MEKIQDTFKHFLLRIFDIRDVELRRAFLMQFNIFLIISTLLIVKPTVNALFLAKFGVEQLPFAFILVAVIAAIVSTLYSHLLTKISLYKLSLGTLVFSILSLVFFGFFLRLNLFENTILYLFYIWVSIFALLSTSQFWILANMVFNPREAKRLFGFVGAGAIAGGIFGGYLTSVLAEPFGSENLPFVGAMLLFVSVFITHRIWKDNVLDVTPKYERQRTISKPTKYPFQLIRQSKHLTYIACIVGISVMVAKLVDYQFGGIASKLIPDTDELTAFFGFWFSTFNVISLLFQLFLTRRLVGTYGVGMSLFFLPTLILIAATLLIFFPQLLMAAVFLKMADGSLKQSINKASMELLIMPISQEIKSQTKTFIDVFVDSLATGIIGLLLIFVIKGLELPMIVVSWMIVGLLFLWIYFADQVRKEYLNTFKIKLQEIAPKTKPVKLFNLNNESVLGGWRKVLQEGEEGQILFVLNQVRKAPDNRLFESIKNLLEHPSDEIKAEALRNLYFFKKNNLSQEVKLLVNHRSQKVKIAAMEYLFMRDPSDEVELMKQYISDSDYRVSGAALVSLAKEARRNTEIQRMLNLDNILDKKIKQVKGVQDVEELQFLKISILKAIGYSNFTSYYHIIKQYFSESDMRVVQESITAAGNTLNVVFINDLLSFLMKKEIESFAQKALIHYDEGLIDILKYKIQQPEIELEILRKIPSVVKQIGRQKSVDFLFQLLESRDGVVRLEALRGLNMLRNNHSHLKFNETGIAQKIFDEANLYQDTLSVLYSQNQLEETAAVKSPEAVVEARKSLVLLLEKRLNRNLERIFRLLGLKYPPDDILNIYRGLSSNQSDMSVNAIEFLDNLLEPNIKKVLIPLIETSMLESVSEEAIRNLKLKIPEEKESFGMLLNGHDRRIKISVLFLIAQLKNREYLPIVKPLMQDENEKVRKYAEEAFQLLS